MKSIVKLCCLLCACLSASAQVRDREGNTYPVKLMPDNKTWTISNLALHLPGSYCYGDEEQSCKKYGRLYTWKAAQEGCRSLGEGWRLPTYEEWKGMARHYGGIFGDSKDSGRTAFRELLTGGKSGFDAVLGGGRSEDGKEYKRMEAHGFYWTATGTSPGMAWFGNFGKGSGKFFIQNDGEQDRGFSVRCVKD